MAIAFDAQATSAYLGTPGVSYTFNHTCTGSNRILFVMTVNNVSGATVTSVTYNSVAMTKINNVVNTNLSNVTLWYLIAPTTGTNVVSVTASTSCNQIAKSVSYTGVAQSGQPDATSVGGPTTTTSYSQSVTTVADNCWAVLAGAGMSGATITAGSNTTIRNAMELSLAGSFILDTNSAKTPAGTDTMTVTSASQQFTGVMASFSPVVTASQTSPGFIFNFI